MNELLIRDVFSRMAEHKPILQKYLIADEVDEEVDTRILGDLIIRNLPWPIGGVTPAIFWFHAQPRSRETGPGV